MVPRPGQAPRGEMLSTSGSSQGPFPVFNLGSLGVLSSASSAGCWWMERERVGERERERENE